MSARTRLRRAAARLGSGAWVHLATAAGVVFSFAAIVAGTLGELHRQHQALIQLAVDQRTSQLRVAAATVGQDFADFGEDLDFAARLVAQSGSPEAARQSMSALLGSVRPYRLVALYGPTCERELLVRDPRGSELDDPVLLDRLDREGASACAERRTASRSSSPVGGGDLEWYRVLSRAVSSDAGGSGSVALLIDTRSALAGFRTLSADPSTDLLVLGPRGRTAPISSPRLRDADRSRSPGLDGVRAHMAAGEDGIAVLPASEAVALGYPDAELVVAYTPIQGSGSPEWSAAALVSLAAHRDHERGVIVRVLGSGLAATSVLVLLGAYVVRVARAEAASRERLAASDEIAHLRERAERILDHVPAGVVALGAGGTVTAANESARRWRPEPAESLDRFLGLASPAARSAVVELVRAARDQRQVRSIHATRLDLFGFDGSYTVHAVPIVPATAEVELLLVVSDLSEVAKLQEQLLRVEKLATVGVLAAGIAHEVGTPLGVIRGRAELVARKVDPPLAPNLSVIVDQIDRITRTISALLEFSAPRAVERARPIAVAASVDQVHELVAWQIEKRKVAFTVETEPDLPALRADPDQIQQVLLNLVMNALDASAPGGAITIRTFGTESALVLSVRDTGCGIDPEHVHRVFDPFFTTKKRGQGTGLGLTVVNQIARAHGGEVRVESERGRGTTVEVELPWTGGASARTT